MSGLEYTRTWRHNWKKALGDDIYKKYIRGCASGYIQRKEVRENVFKKYQSCNICGSKENLTIDHIISAYRAGTGEYQIEEINRLENLQVLCKSCNSAKTP